MAEGRITPKITGLPPVTLITFSAWSATPRAFFCYVAFMRGIFVDGPFKGNCCVLEHRGKRVSGLERLPMLATKPFRGRRSIILATPCDRNEPKAVFYIQQRNDDGSPQLNLMGDILYRAELAT